MTDQYEDVQRALADMRMKIIMLKHENPDITRSELFAEIIRYFFELRATINLDDLIKFLEKEGY